MSAADLGYYYTAQAPIPMIATKSSNSGAASLAVSAAATVACVALLM